MAASVPSRQSQPPPRWMPGRTPWESAVQTRPNELNTNATAGNPWIPHYPGPEAPNSSANLAPPGTGGIKPAPTRSTQNPGMAGLLPPPVGPPPREPQIPYPPQVPPINIQSILGQWQSIQNPGPPRERGIPHIDDTAAVQSAMGRAKDTAGQQGRAAMDALMDVQGARGIVGSGLGVNEAGGLIQEQARQLGDVNRGILEKSYDTELQRQEANLGSRLSQRGQDIDVQNLNQQLLPMLTSLFGLRQQGGLSGRGQDADFGLGQRGQDVTQRGQDAGILQALARLRY